MAIDFNTGLRTLQTLGEQASRDQQMQLDAQQARIQQQRADQQAYVFGRQQRQDQQRLDLGAYVRNGGAISEARQQAVLGGDFEFGQALDGLRNDQLAQLQRETDTIGNLYPHLQTLPPEQRAQVGSQALLQAGFTPQEVATHDWSDAGLAATYAQSKAAQAALAAKLKAQEPYTLNQGDRRYSGSTLLAENPAAAKYEIVPEGATAVRIDGGGATPVYGGFGGGGTGSVGGGATAGRTQYGWTPRARNGGDNTDAAVDSKLAGMSRYLRLDPTTPFPDGMSDIQIARALTLSEGGAGSIADRNNNPGNLRDPKTGAYRRFASKEDGLQAAAAQVRRNRARGQNTISAMVEGVPVGGQTQAGGAPSVIVGRPKQDKDQYRLLSPQEAQAQGLDPNTRWQVNGHGKIDAIPARGDKPLTEGQGKAVGFLERAVAASNALNQVRGYNPTVLASNLDRLGTANPFREGLSQTDRRALTGIRSFVLAVLRQDSGAAINKDEFDQMAQTMFPLPGDGPEVQADKRRQREAAIRGLRTTAGPGSDSVSRIQPGPRSYGNISPERLRQFRVTK